MIEIKTQVSNFVYYIAKLGERYVYLEDYCIVMTDRHTEKVKLSYQTTHALRRQNIEGLEIFKVSKTVKTITETTETETFCPDPYAGVRKIK